MTDGARVRQAEVADAEAISRIILKALRQTNAADYPAAVIDAVAASFTPERIAARFADRVVLVAEVEGYVVGTASLEGRTVRSVFVEPERQTRGVGTALMEAVEHLATTRRIATLTVPSSITAEGFYRKLGFVAVRDEFHGSERTIVMCKRLSTEPQAA